MSANSEITSMEKPEPLQESFLKYISESIRQNWDIDALTDYRGETLKYKDVARLIERVHILFEGAGVKRGDKVALCGRNSSRWGVMFLATLTYGAVSVPILNDFKADNIHNIVNHSDSKLLFVGDNVWENLDEANMPNLKGIFAISNLQLLVTRSSGLRKTSESLNHLLGKKYPKTFMAKDIHYFKDRPDDLAYISYTSGTTSFSKGVMIPYRSLRSNLIFAHENMPLNPGDSHVCMLPLAHAFGLLFSFLFEFSRGCHTYFLTRMPSPKIIFAAYAEVKPNLIITVPLIVEKVVRKAIFPVLQKKPMKMMMRVPVFREKILHRIRQKLMNLFGGELMELVIGGASMNEEVEAFLKEIHFPYTIGYGMTETGPLICYAASATFKQGSCGRPVDRMKVKVDSADPERIVGEIIIKGDNVMLGYYKNKEASADAFTADGWMHTGDLGVMDAAQNLTIRGRCKNMLLGPNGQNIYPEEIEDKLNSLPYVAESLIVEQGGKIVALIHPDYTQGQEEGLSSEDVEKLMEQNRLTLNAMLPRYSQVAGLKIYPEEFEKTPKRSIKRYLYV